MLGSTAGAACGRWRPGCRERVSLYLATQVVLPEGAKDPKVSLALPFQLEQSTAFTYLDVMGR